MTPIARLVPPSAAERAALRDGPTDRATFEAAFARFECLHAVELEPAPEPAPLPASLRIVFGNAERLERLDERPAFLAGAAAEVLLSVEVDVGMPRSGTLDTVRERARRLGTGSGFGVAFAELDLGVVGERARPASGESRSGSPGAAILSRSPVARPALVRLEISGRSFDGGFGGRRVGGRTARRSRPSPSSPGSSRAGSAAGTRRFPPAVDRAGKAISDHEALAVTVGRAPSGDVP